MPQRFLRPGITTSERFNKLPWQAQSLYVRLITLVDDYGRFEANPLLLKSLAFPYNPEITCEQMISLCEHLLANDCTLFYEVSGKKYLQITRWSEKARSESKYPAFVGKIEDCKQMLANVSKCSAPSPSPSPSPSSIVASLRVSSSDEFALAIYEAYPKKVGKPIAIQAIKKALKKTTFDDLLKKTEEYRRSRNGEDPKFTLNPATFFNQERYNDDAATWKNEYDFKKPKPVGGNF